MKSDIVFLDIFRLGQGVYQHFQTIDNRIQEVQSVCQQHAVSHISLSLSQYSYSRELQATPNGAWFYILSPKSIRYLLFIVHNTAMSAAGHET